MALQDEFDKEGIIMRFSLNLLQIVIMTPLMRRAHNLSSAKHICFIDSTSSCDKENHTVTLLLTSSAAGAVPLGVAISNGSSQEEYTVTCLFE
jgi:hypothetical protein